MLPWMYFFDIGHSELVIDTQLLEFSLNNSYWICAWQHDKIQQNYGYTYLETYTFQNAE